MQKYQKIEKSAIRDQQHVSAQFAGMKKKKQSKKTFYVPAKEKTHLEHLLKYDFP